MPTPKKFYPKTVHAYLIALLLLLSGCAPSYLALYTRYLSEETLASYVVNTPDPALSCPSIGQRLILTWSIPKHFLFCYHSLQIVLTIRFHNHEEIEKCLTVDKRRGTFVYDLKDDDFLAKGGIMTYKADLIADEIVLEEWRHEMWIPLVAVSSDHNIPSNPLQQPVAKPEPFPFPDEWGGIEDEF